MIFEFSDADREFQQAVTELALEASGYYAEPFDASTPLEGDNFAPVGPEAANGVAQDYFNTRKVSIYAGSNGFSATSCPSWCWGSKSR